MSRISTPITKQLIALLFCLLFAGSHVMSMTANKSAQRQNSNKFGKSTAELIEQAMNIVSNFGGDTVANIIKEFMDNLKQTINMLKSLSNDDVIDSANYLINSSIICLADAARQMSNANGTSDTMQHSDFAEFLDTFKSVLNKRLKNKSNFSVHITTQLDIMLPAVLQGLNELYENVITSTGFGLSFGMLTQGTSLLGMLERPEYVSKDTFRSFVNFPEEMKDQLEIALDNLIGPYVDRTQLGMMLNMAEMYSQNFANSRHREKEEL